MLLLKLITKFFKNGQTIVVPTGTNVLMFITSSQKLTLIQAKSSPHPLHDQTFS